MANQLLRRSSFALFLCFLPVSIGCGGGVKAAQNNGAPQPTPIPISSPTPTATPGGSPTPTATPTPGAATQQPRLLASVIPSEIQPGQNATLFWTAENADAVVIDGIGNFSGPEGSATISPGSTSSYNVTATNSAGASQVTLTVTVTAPAANATSRRIKAARP